MSRNVFIGDQEYFPGIGRIGYEGPGTDNPLSFKAYDPERVVAGKTMEEHLRFSVAYWHTFCGAGGDPFGPGTREYDCVHNMLVVLANGGLGSGGLNFDAKARRESTDLEDLFIAHIGGMDAYARALVIADRIRADGRLEAIRSGRYSSFGTGHGRRFERGELVLAELRDIAASGGEPERRSGKQEWVENLVNDYMFS